MTGAGGTGGGGGGGGTGGANACGADQECTQDARSVCGLGELIEAVPEARRWTKKPARLECSNMDVDAFLALSPRAFRERVPSLVSGPIDDAVVAAAIEQELAEFIGSFSDADIASILDAVANIGAEWRPYDAHPLIRRAGRIWSRHVLAGSALEGLEHLITAKAAGPTVVVCNHRAYIDSNTIDTILHRHAPSALADRFVSAAGPKVYQGLFRRLASNSLNTIPVPQTASLNHGPKLSKLELARRSLAAVAHSHQAMKKGHVLLLFPEGSRTRSGRTQPFLSAVFRYFKLPNTRVVPAALTGTDQVMPVGTRGVYPGPCALRFGPAIVVKRKGEAREALEHAERSVSELLPLPSLSPSRCVLSG